MKLCGHCNERPLKKNRNAKWCYECAEKFKKTPKHTLTPEQQALARRLVGTMSRNDVAKRVGVTLVNLGRWARANKIGRMSHPGGNKWNANPELVKQICDFYIEHGRVKTQEQFPGIKVRSVVEHYARGKHRQIPWTDDQIIELAQMAGLVSHEAQAVYFNRPGAGEGSIKSAWMKRFKQNGAHINGISWHVAKSLVDVDCSIQTAYWTPRAENRRKCSRKGPRRIVLWVDLEKHLSQDWLREVVRSMARFQRWLHGTQDVRSRVLQLIEERESNAQRAA